MFPDPCGAALAEAVRNGADPRMVVPDEYFVVRGGIKPLPPARTVFSAVTGPTLEAAACAVPNNQLRAASARLIRANGGSVEWLAEYSPHGTLNEQHVNVIEYASTSFYEPQPNPVSKKLCIDAGA